MAKRDILKEAIADAKAVKEVAIANAKAALEEAFTPKLRSMLATKIEEMEEAEDEKDEKEKLKKEHLSNPDMRHGMRGDTDPEERETEYMRDRMEEDEDVDLEEILAELESDLNEDARTDAEEEGYKDGMKDEKEDLSEDEKTDAEEEGYEDGMEDEKEDIEGEDEAEEIDLEDMTDEDLKVFIEDVISDMVGSGELEAGENFEDEDVDVEVEDDVDVDVESEEEVEISEGKKGNKDEQKRAEGAIRDDRKHIKKLKGDIDFQEKKLAKLKKDAKKELDEAYAAVDTLRSELSEVNLLNAKLLYTNKIFKSKNLTESQKIKVLGAFDNATTVKESKLVFETLSEGLKSKKNPIRESLGRASKSLGTTRSKNPIVETDPMVSRFQKLAGIK